MEKLKPEQAAEMLRKKGIGISKKHAEKVLEILRLFADVLIENYLKERTDRLIPLKRKRKRIEYNLNEEP